MVCDRSRRQFVSSMIHTDTSEKIMLRSLKWTDQSILPCLFTANLSQRDVRLTKSEFIIVARQYVFLPPLKNDQGEVIESKCGCDENHKDLKQTETLKNLPKGNFSRIL